MKVTALAEQLQLAIAELDRTLAAMRADKPNVIDGHSDGKRVRYCRTETRRETLETVLALVERLDR